MTPLYVDYHPPTRARTVSREEAMRRISLAEHPDGDGGPLDREAAAEAGRDRRILARAAVVAVIAAIAGALAGLALSRVPGALEVRSTGGTVGYMIVLGIAGAIIATLVATLLMLEREDGRTEREMERRQAAARARGPRE